MLINSDTTYLGIICGNSCFYLLEVILMANMHTKKGSRRVVTYRQTQYPPLMNNSLLRKFKILPQKLSGK